jgi:hypothetical protein
MSQQRLNDVLVLDTHRYEAKSLDLRHYARDFVVPNFDTTFGNEEASFFL